MAIRSTHKSDQIGNPAGGLTTGTGFAIHWQNGPMIDPASGLRRAQNGAFVEDIIEAALDRLRYFQGLKYQCRENAMAITKLEEALHWLMARTRDRQARGVEGQHKV